MFKIFGWQIHTASIVSGAGAALGWYLNHSQQINVLLPPQQQATIGAVVTLVGVAGALLSPAPKPSPAPVPAPAPMVKP